MFGFDQDDRGIFRRTVEFLEEASIDVTTMSMVVPMPGTPTFQRWQAEGRILTTDWSKYDGDRKSTRLNSSHIQKSRMPSSA